MMHLICILFFFLFHGFEACNLEGYVPLPPSIRQITENEVFVDWIAAASEKVDITDYELKYWQKDSGKGKNTIDIDDLYTNFVYLSVEEWTVYSYQLMVKTSGKIISLLITSLFDYPIAWCQNVSNSIFQIELNQ